MQFPILLLKDTHPFMIFVSKFPEFILLYGCQHEFTVEKFSRLAANRNSCSWGFAEPQKNKCAQVNHNQDNDYDFIKTDVIHWIRG